MVRRDIALLAFILLQGCSDACMDIMASEESVSTRRSRHLFAPDCAFDHLPKAFLCRKVCDSPILPPWHRMREKKDSHVYPARPHLPLLSLGIG